jgi:O-antigen ligase
MEHGAVGAADAPQLTRRTDDATAIDATAISALVLLLALAAAAFGQGAYFSSVRLFIAALLAVAVVLALAAGRLLVADLRDGLVVAGVLLAGWALFRGWTAGTAQGAVSWALFGAGTVAVVVVCRRLGETARGMLLGGLLAVGVAVAMTGWAGVALHMGPWGLRSQGLWRAASTVTYTNATAALLVPLTLVALARRTATPRATPLSLAVMCLLMSTALTLSRAGAAALGLGLLVLCWLLGVRRVIRAVAVPAAGACVALVGLVPSLRAGEPARPVYAAVALAAGLGLAILAQRWAGWKLALPAAGVALAAAVVLTVLVPQVRDTARAITHARLTLSSPARSGETSAALHVIATHPLLGVGPGHALQWTGPGGVVFIDQYVHDEYLQVLTDLGAVGAALTAILLVAVGRLLWQARTSAPDRVLWAGAVAAAIAFALHSGFDFLWQVPVVPLTVAAIVGLAVCPSTVQRRQPPDITVPPDRS